MSKNPTYHKRTKHIDMRSHFIKEIIERREVQVLKVSNDDKDVDMITKSLSSSKFFHCM